MNKKTAIFISLLITAIIYSFFSVTDNNSSTENVIISRVIDGDTIELDDGRIVRLLNINSPEKTSPNSNLSSLLLKSYENKEVSLEKTGTDKYNRILARIYTPEYLNLIIVEEGLASKFLVQDNEKTVFYKAEEKAISQGIGIWQKSEFSNCIEITEINPKDEVITLLNNCQDNKINGFYLKDESRKTYTFKNNEFKKINLHTTEGSDNSTDKYWDLKTDVWNNDVDTAYIFDEKGNIISHKAYGY